MTRVLLLSLLACLAPLGCQHAPTPSQPAGEFRPTGEIQFFDQGASFSQERVVGPNIDLARRADGSWAGRIEGQPVDLTDYRRRVAGVDLKLAVENTPTGQVVTGQWRGQILRFEVHPDVILVRAASRSFTLSGRGAGQYGPDGQLRLSGEAAHAHPPFPQFALAMLGAFISSTSGSPTGYGANPNRSYR